MVHPPLPLSHSDVKKRMCPYSLPSLHLRPLWREFEGPRRASEDKTSPTTQADLRPRAAQELEGQGGWSPLGGIFRILIFWLFDFRREGEVKGDFPLIHAEKKRSFAFENAKKAQCQ